MRAPAALADRWKLGRGGEGARVGGRIDHGRDDALGAEIEHAAYQCEIAEWHAHQRCGAALPNRGNTGEDAVDIP